LLGLASAFCLLYTPENEHFGIVPVEAGLAKTVVLACKSGGPTETIVDGVTGFLLQSSTQEWATVLHSLITEPFKAKEMGEAACEHVLKNFSTEKFISQLDESIKHMLGN